MTMPTIISLRTNFSSDSGTMLEPMASAAMATARREGPLILDTSERRKRL
jgi:hypothetical protein